MSTRILVIQHENECPIGFLGTPLAEAGLEVDSLMAHQGRPIPAALTDHDALIVLGGEMGALDDDVAPWLPAVRRLIAGTVGAGLPYLGVCLGHQLAAVALGGEIGKNPAGQARGLTAYQPNDEGLADPLMSAASSGSLAVQWNGDVITQMPPRAQPLAFAPDGSIQAVRFAPLAWGVQFHPEAGASIFRSWTTEKPSAQEARADGIDIFALADAIEAHEPSIKEEWAGLAARFAQVVVENAAQPPSTQMRTASPGTNGSDGRSSTRA
ncbi:type 1 glutamine amidotransferase [Ornithinimicrobium sp. Arc0846-15]|nr:type 1 glutamine amidotransferase [Ornithinimicrobium laminariae]